ncbi:S41 family peptidase [Lacinutrix sp.]|uniref:S41 family peptidase n=1 Tax=Lacinutrix sp. TaxID=1937692 RepID=UPI0025C4A5A2|nr:S41 family peptidase [Lacinutrix sp.]
MRTKLTLILFIYISFLPIYAQKITENPIVNFDKLWSEFDNRYANFKLKSIDWDSVYAKYRPKISEESTSNELFNVCCEMLKELDDGHISLEGEINAKERYCGIENKVHIISEFKSFNNLRILVDKSLEENGFSSFMNKKKNGLINFSVSANYGYLRIDEMEGFAIGELKKSINQAIRTFQDKKGLIIDVRFNGGGDDLISYKIAGRFADKKRLGHYKQTRINGTSNFTELESWYLKPKGRKQFTNPIIILTSDWSASATEIFILAMKELPYVTIIGDTTEGILSDMYPFKLPNGWKGTLSHQKYFSTKMVNYEGKGIEPDFKILNYKQDKSDVVLLKAIELLDKNYR